MTESLPNEVDEKRTALEIEAINAEERRTENRFNRRFRLLEFEKSVLTAS